MSDSGSPTVDVSAILNSEEAPQVEAPQVEDPAEDPAVVEPAVSEGSTSVSTEEVVENVKEMLTSASPVKSTEERLNDLIELLKGTSERFEYDDDKYRWVGPLVNIREELNEL